MNKNSTRAMGALHPIIFFVIVYGISLFMALIVCNSVYHYIHGDDNLADKEIAQPLTQNSTTSIAMNTH
ncbi:MAG: hypothetical protein C4329_15345 [Chitinophagaceae bacterium]